MRTTIDEPKAACLSKAEPAPRGAPVFWLSTLATAALALFAIYGGILAAPSLTTEPTATSAPATPFGDFVQLAERLKAR